MPRCKNEECRIKFVARYFNQKYCSKECLNACDGYQKPINKVSASMEARLEIYRPLAKEYLKANQFCERCASKAIEVHHKAGREGDNLTDVDTFMAVCRTCHNYIHEHPMESRKKGYMI